MRRSQCASNYQVHLKACACSFSEGDESDNFVTFSLRVLLNVAIFVHPSSSRCQRIAEEIYRLVSVQVLCVHNYYVNFGRLFGCEL